MNASFDARNYSRILSLSPPRRLERHPSSPCFRYTYVCDDIPLLRGGVYEQVLGHCLLPFQRADFHQYRLFVDRCSSPCFGKEPLNRASGQQQLKAFLYTVFFHSRARLDFCDSLFYLSLFCFSSHDAVKLSIQCLHVCLLRFSSIMGARSASLKFPYSQKNFQRHGRGFSEASIA